MSLDKFAFMPVSIADTAKSGEIVATGTVVPVAMDIQGPTHADKTLKVLMLFDSSGSMTVNDPKNLRINAGKEFISRLATGVEVAIMDFRKLHQKFTDDADDLRKAIVRIGADGGTPLFGKINEAIDQLKGSDAGDRTVLVLSDGKADKDDIGQKQKVIERAKEESTRILSVGLGSGIDFSDLEQLARQTGGSFVRVEEAEQLEQFFDAIATSVSEGRIVLTGQVSFDKSLKPDQSYEVSGSLLTSIAGGTEKTPFRFETTIREE